MSTQNTSVRPSIPLLNNNNKKFSQESTTLQLSKEPTHSRNKNPFFPRLKPLSNKASLSHLTPSLPLPPNPSCLSEPQWQNNKEKKVTPQLAKQARKRKGLMSLPTLLMVHSKEILHSYLMETEAPPDSSWSILTFSKQSIETTTL